LNNLLTQHARISLLVDLEKIKLNDLDLIKQMFELIKLKTSSSFSCNSLTNVSMIFDLTLNSSSNNTTRQVKIKPQQVYLNEKFYRIINQLLIIYLTKLNYRDNCFKISIQLNENLGFFIDFYKKMSIDVKKSKNLVQNDLSKLYCSINSVVYYFYKSNFDLSKICLNLKLLNSTEIKQLNENIGEIEKIFYSNIYQDYNSKKAELMNNKLEQIKRVFFVDFYLNPQNVANIIERFNNI
jgi:hypothetical protein